MDAPHLPLASSRSSSTSYFAPHVQSMSSNGSNNEHSPLTGSVAPSLGQPYVPHSDPIESTEIADAFRQLTLHSPTQLGHKSAETVFEISVPNAQVAEDADGPRVMFSDYLFRLPYADYHWDCIFILSWSTHKALTLILVLLHRDLFYHCTIRSDSSTPCPCTITSWSLYDTICY